MFFVTKVIHADLCVVSIVLSHSIVHGTAPEFWFLTLWLWMGTQGRDLEGPVGFALRHGDFGALL